MNEIKLLKNTYIEYISKACEAYDTVIDFVYEGDNNDARSITTPVKPPEDGLIDEDEYKIKFYSTGLEREFTVHVCNIRSLRINQGNIKNDREIPTGGLVTIARECYEEHKHIISRERFMEIFFHPSIINSNVLVQDLIRFLSILKFQFCINDLRENNIDIESLKSAWTEVIHSSRDEAIEVLTREKQHAVDNKYNDVLQDIDDIMSMLSTLDVNASFGEDDSVADVLSYWPAVLLPTPHNLPIQDFVAIPN